MKKYAYLHPLLLARVTAEESNKKDPAKAAKTRLHQMYGAYLSPTACKKAGAILDAPGQPPESLLSLHASTRERLPHYPDFYRFVFAHVPPPASLLDLGCGFNPFSLPFLLKALPENHPFEAYHAYDIDTQQAALLNRFFTLHSLPAAATCLDLAAEITAPFPPAGLALLLKLLPVLEAQRAGAGFALARALPVPHLVISYPLKSLSGKEKGMAHHYRHTFETALHTGQLSPFTLRAEKQIGTEWVYILEKVTSSLTSPEST
ncbi:MAG: hypothetical protein FWB88_04710 [Defluviitaleaceae bacterium]|nr:hypothetical protein [Defluviitaleaceae bacterium]MCL2238670.1 hypothetical protein [Defluviitaleaceae bacterium]